MFAALTTAAVTVEPPAAGDAGAVRDLVAATGVLDVNSRYAYALWFRDFADTSVVARSGADVIGLVSGFRRTAAPSTLFVWQVAVSDAARGRGVAAAMLDGLWARLPGLDHLETTITADNDASIALFSAFARRHGMPIRREPLFGEPELGSHHEPEDLYRIGG